MQTLALVENIFFLVLVAIVGLIRWISAAAENKKNAEAAKRLDPETASAPLPRAPAQTEEERIRRFMEALGVPPATAAPQPKAPRREILPQRPRKIQPIDPFPRPQSRPWIPEPVVVPLPAPVVVSAPAPIPEAPLPPPRQTLLKRAPGEPDAAEFEVQLIGATPPTVASSRSDQNWARRLRNPSALRDAVILREILGRPRSMQSVEQDLLTKI